MAEQDYMRKGLSAWEPPSHIPRHEIVQTSQAVLATPDMKIKQTEDIFRIRELEMDWDMGVMVYEPEHSAPIPVGADGKKVGRVGHMPLSRA